MKGGRPMMRPLPSVYLSRRQRRRIRRGLGDPAQSVAIGVVKRLGLTGNDQQRVLLIRPCAVLVNVDLDGVAIRAERLLEKGIRNDAVDERTTNGIEGE